MEKPSHKIQIDIQRTIGHAVDNQINSGLSPIVMKVCPLLFSAEQLKATPWKQAA